MKRWRVWLVFALAAALGLGHFYDIVFQREHWPFSYYQMYARVQKKQRLQLLNLCIVVTDGRREKQIRITDQNYVPQLSEARIRNIFMVAWGRADLPNPHAVRDAGKILGDYLRMYEMRRLNGLHKGQQAVEAQLCKVTWKLRPDASRQKPTIEPLLGVRADGKVVQYFKPATRPTTGASDDEPND